MNNQKPLPCDPILLSAKSAAKATDVSLSLWYRLDQLGLTPKPVSLCSKRLWSYQQLTAWADAGCPARDSCEWQNLLVRIKERSE
jgi:hypothetical protein